MLVVQRTGWGKSLIYFIATRMLRDAGSGPTILISPLLSLMRNQVEMASRIGIQAFSINSANSEEWATIDLALERDECDILLVSPERLANEHFRANTLPSIARRAGLFAVDEAHCISDWGHDFRPDYRRIVRIVRNLPRGVAVLATTATANNRVVADIAEQLGPNLRVLRGSLARPSIRIQTLRLNDQAERLAWLSQHLPTLPGSGIVYCLTVADCERVSGWLATRGVRTPAYHAGLPANRRIELEQQLLRNKVKALVATVALGMGFDKPDIGFIVHYQRPGSVIAYYQQIGRAGRARDNTFAILLNGSEDDEIQDYFIRSAHPGTVPMLDVLQVIELRARATINDLLGRINLSRTRVEQCLKLLEVEGAIVREGGRYRRSVNRWAPDEARAQRVSAIRNEELRRVQQFVTSSECLMQFLERELDDPEPEPCGCCAVCSGDVVPRSIDPELVQRAVAYLKHDSRPIEPKRQWPALAGLGRREPIEARFQNLAGRALAVYGDAGWGGVVEAGKYRNGRFDDELVRAAEALVSGRWRPVPAPIWVTAVPSLRRPTLVCDFAERLAIRLGLAFRPVLVKVREIPEQKGMQNSAQQFTNIHQAFSVLSEEMLPGPLLLVDDLVDSGWTLTVCGVLLREAGSGPVHPFALASTSGARKAP